MLSVRSFVFLFFAGMLLFALVSCSDSEPPFDTSITWQKVVMPHCDIIDDIGFTPTGSVLVSVQGNLYRKSAGSSWQKVLDRSGSGPILLHVFSNGTIYIYWNFDYRAKSTDDGQTWHSSELIACKTNVQLDNGTIYVGHENGMVYSTDNGLTWLTESLFNGHSIPSIVRDRNGNLFAADSYDSKIWKMHTGIWTEISTAPNGIFDLNIDSLGNLFLTGYDSESLPRTIFKSVNAGVSWTQVSTPPNDPAIDFIVLPNNELLLTTEKAVWRSSDAGMTWTRSDAGIARPGITAMAFGSVNDLYCGGTGLYHSTDNGASWNFITAGASADRINVLKGKTSLFSGGELLYRSDDGGVSWVPLSLKNQGAIRKILFGETGEILVTDGDGLYRSADNGENWQIIYNSGIYDFTVNPQGTLFLTEATPFAPDNVFMSSNHGSSWVRVTNGLPYYVADQLQMLPSGRPALLLYHQIYMLGSDNTWDSIPGPGKYEVLLDFTVSPSGVIIAGYTHFYRSSDLGLHWTSVQTTSPRFLYWFNEVLFASGMLHSRGSPGAGVMYSADYGSSWKNPLQGMDNYQIRCVGFLDNGYVFAAGDSSLYRSSQPFQEANP